MKRKKLHVHLLGNYGLLDIQSELRTQVLDSKELELNKPKVRALNSDELGDLINTFRVLGEYFTNDGLIGPSLAAAEFIFYTEYRDRLEAEENAEDEEDNL